MRSIGDKPTCYGREISVCGVCYSQCWRLKNAAGLEPAALTSEKRSTSGLRFVETSVNGLLSTWQTGTVVVGTTRLRKNYALQSRLSVPT